MGAIEATPATTKSRPAAAMIVLYGPKVTPPTTSCRLRRTVLASKPARAMDAMDASWIIGLITALTRPSSCGGVARRISGSTTELRAPTAKPATAQATRAAGSEVQKARPVSPTPAPASPGAAAAAAPAGTRSAGNGPHPRSA
ncbi:MAG: hypothetical protein ABJB47_06025 [Actinomycetota bacterium]